MLFQSDLNDIKGGVSTGTGGEWRGVERAEWWRLIENLWRYTYIIIIFIYLTSEPTSIFSLSVRIVVCSHCDFLSYRYQFGTGWRTNSSANLELGPLYHNTRSEIGDQQWSRRQLWPISIVSSNECVWRSRPVRQLGRCARCESQVVPNKNSSLETSINVIPVGQRSRIIPVLVVVQQHHEPKKEIVNTNLIR